jgi:UDP-glucose 4-epimerase
MRVVVTGGAGFIGSHVVDVLLDEGVEVVVLDNLSTGKLENIKSHMKNPNFRFVRGDIRIPKTVREVLKGADAVVHEAAAKSVTLSFKNPKLTYEINVRGTLNVLQAASDVGVRRVVFASSAAVYGDQQTLPMQESLKPKPLSPYGESKLLGEQECLKFSKEGRIETVCLRYFNVYGRRMTSGPYAGVMLNFAKRIRKNLPPIIYGDGKQTRDFIHVRDIAEATKNALFREKAAGEVINVGSGRSTTINKLCALFLQISGKTDLRPLYQPPRPGEIRHSRADIKRAKRILGFKPRIGLRNGVKDLLQYLKVI